MSEMRKVISSKNMPMKRNNLGTGRRKAYHKKTLCSTWETRNDSSNVNAILHPDLATPRKCIHDAPTKPAHESKGVYKKCCLGSNTCYCREKPIKPKLLSRPNKCPSLEAFRKNIKERKDNNLSRMSLHCLCEGDDASAENINKTDSDLIKKYKEELEKNSTSLQYTDQRKDYNLFREEHHEESLNDILAYEMSKRNGRHLSEEKKENGFAKGRNGFAEVEIGFTGVRNGFAEVRNGFAEMGNGFAEMGNGFTGVRNGFEEVRNRFADVGNEFSEVRNGFAEMGNGFAEEREEYDTDKEKDQSISTILGTRKANSKLGSSGFLTEGLNIEELKKFRDDHYFETHAVEYFEGDVPNHICIHQFKLDDRLLPAPINADIYGRSRCSVCNKPMEGDRVQLSRSYFSDKSSKVSLENFSKCYRMGLVPRAISIGGDKSKIELKLSEKNINRFGLFLGKYKRPQYTNTYALRQQKMMC